MPVGQYIPFGLRPDGSLIDPFTAERGLACDCVCPGCRQPLMTRQGDIRVHHFSHVGDHRCSNGQTSALLLAAKQALAKERRIAVPGLVVTVHDASPFGKPHQKTSRVAQALWTFESVVLEKPFGAHKADAFGLRGDGTPGIVEFRITSQASDDKRRTYQNENIAAVEVDLRPLLGRSLTLEQLAIEVCDSPANRVWLHHPAAAAIETDLKAQFRTLRNPPPFVAPRAGSGPALFPGRRGTDLNYLDAERLATRREHERYRALSLEQKWAELHAALGGAPENWPGVFAVVLPNSAPSINAPTALWQGALFQHFVLGALVDPRRRDQSFSLAAVNGWTDARFGVVPGTPMAGLFSEVDRFISHLVAKRFLQHSSERYIVIQDALEPSGR